MTLSIHSPDELIAALPHLLGFKPSQSILFVPLRADLPVARVDFPTTATEREQAWSSIGDVFSRHAQPGASVAIVCLTPVRADAEPASQEFASRLASIGIDTPVRLWADDSQWCDMDTGQSGLQTDAARTRIAAATVLDGQTRPATSREALAASLIGNREPIAALLPEARTAAKVAAPQTEARWAQRRLHQFHADGIRLSDADAARLLVAVESAPTRDRLWDDMTRGAAAATHLAFWRDLTRRAPDDVRAAPASMLGFASWLSGDGAMAWCALDQVPQDKPYALAVLVAEVIQTGMHPREWDAATAPARERGMHRVSDLFPLRSGAQQGPARPAPGI